MAGQPKNHEFGRGALADTTERGQPTDLPVQDAARSSLTDATAVLHASLMAPILQ